MSTLPLPSSISAKPCCFPRGTCATSCMAPAAAQRRLIAVAGLLFVVVVVAVVVTGRRAHRSKERLLAPLPAAGVDYCQAELETGYGVGGNGTKLAMAIVIARHGDRAPVDLLPNEDDVSWSGCGRYRMDLIADGSEDAFAGFNYSSPPSGNPYAHGMWTGECTAGQLTSKGAQQLAVLGARLKARWIDRLSLTTAIPGALNLSLRSTDIPRARESAEYLIGTRRRHHLDTPSICGRGHGRQPAPLPAFCTTKTRAAELTQVDCPREGAPAFSTHSCLSAGHSIPCRLGQESLNRSFF